MLRALDRAEDAAQPAALSSLSLPYHDLPVDTNHTNKHSRHPRRAYKINAKPTHNKRISSHKHSAASHTPSLTQIERPEIRSAFPPPHLVTRLAFTGLCCCQGCSRQSIHQIGAALYLKIVHTIRTHAPPLCFTQRCARPGGPSPPMHQSRRWASSCA